jgi:hypothetical protein
MTTSPSPADERRATAAADRRAMAVTAFVVTAAALFAVTAVAFGTTHQRDIHAGSPVGTVRSFLVDAAVDHYGVDGCRYLTTAAQRRLEDAQSPHPSCEIALSHRQLTLGGREIATEAAVKALGFRAQQDGTRAIVTVSGHGGSLTFRLRRATAPERAEFQPPPTGWRIDSGVDGLTGW